MIKSVARFAATLLLVLTVTGCGKKAEQTAEVTIPAEDSATSAAPSAKVQEVPPAPGKEVLPGASSVRAALERKDYETAVGGLLALRGAATQPPQSGEYIALYDEVKFVLMDASLTDPKAATALGMLRAATAGR